MVYCLDQRLRKVAGVGGRLNVIGRSPAIVGRFASAGTNIGVPIGNLSGGLDFGYPAKKCGRIKFEIH